MYTFINLYTGSASLASLNLTTGVATRIGTATSYGIGYDLSGSRLVAHSGTLYMVTEELNIGLFTIDTNTGVASARVNISPFSVSGTTKFTDSNSQSVDDFLGMTDIEGELFVSADQNQSGGPVLYKLNISTAKATRVGNVRHYGVTHNAGSQFRVRGLAYG